MSKAFIAALLQGFVGLTVVGAYETASKVISAVVAQINKDAGFTLRNFGRFTVYKLKARTAQNPHR